MQKGSQCVYIFAAKINNATVQYNADMYGTYHLQMLNTSNEKKLVELSMLGLNLSRI